MEFIHSPYVPGESIAAIATPPGDGGIAVIRISGEDSLIIADRIFSGSVLNYQSHTVNFGHILDKEKNPIDDVLLLVMHNPRSFTGENIVEIHCHGGYLISKRVLSLVLESGARAAKPGEFTFRAFINEKIDLAQAEAIQKIIHSKNEYALNAAQNQLQGKLSEEVQAFQKKLTSIAAILEAWLDFPEEGLEFATTDEIIQQLTEVFNSLQHLIHTFYEGKILQQGISLCLIGSPNVGKSSLMNTLLKKDRAIVSAIPGTTRDLVEDHCQLNGLNVRITDTAGIRDATEQIEQEGIRRSNIAMKEADIVLLVLDSCNQLTEKEQHLLNIVPKNNTVIIGNKVDLLKGASPKWEHESAVFISAKLNHGIEELKKKIDSIIWRDNPPSKEELVITDIRHKEALEKSSLACQNVISGLKSGVSPEFITIEIKDALTHLGKIIGTNISEDILTDIFSNFCIGK